jgi:predicted porin
MKKTLIAMAAVAVAGVASAQVTITGKIGFGVRDGSDTAKEIATTDGGITFAASEDLGGGMTAAASMTVANVAAYGTGVTGDGSTLSLSGPFGKIQYANGGSDSDRLGVGSGLLISGNTVFGGTGNAGAFDYTLPTLAEGLSITVRMNQAGSLPVALTDEDPTLRLSYVAGPVTVGYNTTGGSSPSSDINVTYDAGFAVFKYAADTTVTEGTTDYSATANGSMGKRSEISVTATIGNGLTAGISTGSRKMVADNNMTSDAKALEVNFNYALSKRTSINAAYASVRNNQGVDKTANTVKMVHTF